MKSGSTVFLAAFLALSASWTAFVLVSQVQLGRADQAKTIPAGDKYPAARPGLAQQGAEVYRSLGCVYCHSQQVGQEGVSVEVVLLNEGTNADLTLAAIAKVRPDLAKPETFIGLPKPIAQVADVLAADDLVKAITDSGGKFEIKVVPTGSDMARGWGRRRSVAQDYVYDAVVQPGVRRAGPDLSNVGARFPEVRWHLEHLYAPRTKVADSTMPAYRFLFEQRRIGNAPARDALALTGAEAPRTGYEIVPTDAARALAAYLVSLRAEAPLFETPLTAPAPAATNSVAAK